MTISDLSFRSFWRNVSPFNWSTTLAFALQFPFSLELWNYFRATQSFMATGESSDSFLLAVHSGLITLLSLYDIRAASDTVDHSIPVDRLSKSFRIATSALVC